MMKYALVQTAWGWFGFVVSEKGLVATYLPETERKARAAIRKQWPDAMENPNLLPRFQRQIIDYYLGRPTQFDVPLDLSRVPAFRRQVLELCRRIPYGRTSSYLDLARAVGKPEASRAVGGAMGRNPAPIVIPCHRVLRADGSLGGFSSRSGVREKERLLTLEGVRRPDNRTRPAAASESRPSRREKSTRRSMNQPVSVG